MRCWIALRISTRTEPHPAVFQTLGAAAVQRAVASLALGLTPRVALVDEAVLMDVTGSLRLFGGLARLMRLLAQRLETFFDENGLQSQLERAQGATSLIALGRLRHQKGGTTVKLSASQLPVHTLTAARPHLDVLERIGCRTWDDLLRLPRDGVARRFGAQLLAALDRARGSATDDYEWQLLPEHFEEKLELDALVAHAPALMAGVERLLPQLHAWLLGRQRGLCALKITWYLDKRRDVPPTGELEVRTARPAQDLRHVARLVAERLAREKLPAPVHSLSLESLVTEPLANAADATGSLLMEGRKQGDGVVELVERLSARLGAAQVRAWQPCADHRPELMQRWLPASEVMGSIAAYQSRYRGGDPRRSGDAFKKPSPEIKTEALYPAWLLPEPLKLATAGNSPVYQGKLQRLSGPQRLEAAQWLLADCDSEAARGAGLPGKPWAFRDYFIYRSQQGGLLWIYSERLGATIGAARPRAWYLHGLFA